MTAAVYVYLGLAALAANLPFMIERVLFVLEPKGGRKAFGWRLLEFLLLYLLLGLLGRWLESRFGPVHAQKWPFYATTLALFAVAAFPGFVVRYLWRKPGQ